MSRAAVLDTRSGRKFPERMFPKLENGQQELPQRKIDWSLVFDTPQELFFVPSNPSQNPKTSISYHNAKPIVTDFDRRSNSTPCESQQGRLWNDAKSSKSLPPLRQRHRCDLSSSNNYWMLGKLGPDLCDPQRIEKVYSILEIDFINGFRSVQWIV